MLRDELGCVKHEMPFLSGFDYSRPDNDKYTSGSPFNPKMDWYGTPRRNSRRRRRTDANGTLGIVLVETAHWKPIHEVLGYREAAFTGDSPSKEDIDRRKNVRADLLVIIKSETLFAACSPCFKVSYASITSKCLEGGEAFGLSVKRGHLEIDGRSSSQGERNP